MKLPFCLIPGVQYNESLDEILAVQRLIMEQWINTQSKQKSATATTTKNTLKYQKSSRSRLPLLISCLDERMIVYLPMQYIYRYI